MLSVNALAQFIKNRAAFLDFLVALNPAVVLIMDGMGLALEVKKRLPRTLVIHRSYHPDDKEFHHKWTAQQVVEAFCTNVPEGIIISIFNEPDGYNALPQLSSFMAEVRAKAPRGVRLAYPSFGVGHPKDDFGNELDPMLNALAANPLDVLTIHQYFKDDPALEKPFKILRHKPIHARFHTLHPDKPRPITVVKEAGTDIGGGVNDGFATRFTQEKYAELLVKQATIYLEDGSVDGMCVYCYGEGA